MNRTQCKHKIDDLAQQLAKLAQEKAMALFQSGAIDPTAYGDDYRLPRILMSSALAEVATSFRPNHPADLREVLNLQHF